MFQDFIPDDSAANQPPNNPPQQQPDHYHEIVHHTLFGSLTVVRHTINLLHALNYAEPNDWSKPVPTGRSNEMIAILTKRVRLS